MVILNPTELMMLPDAFSFFYTWSDDQQLELLFFLRKRCFSRNENYRFEGVDGWSCFANNFHFSDTIIPNINYLQ